jgi:hypothetical protein
LMRGSCRSAVRTSTWIRVLIDMVRCPVDLSVGECNSSVGRRRVSGHHPLCVSERPITQSM